MLIQLNKWSIFSQADVSQEDLDQADDSQEISREQLLEALELIETDEEREMRIADSWQKLTQRIRAENEKG